MAADYLATSSGDVPDAFPLHRSADLVRWERVGSVFPAWKTRKNPSWAVSDFWAPDIQRINRTHFACYFSARRGNLLSLGVALSTSGVTGPYVDIGRPLWANESNPEGTIDVHFHQTSSGARYLLWKANQWPVWTSARIMMQRVSDSGTALVGEAWTRSPPPTRSGAPLLSWGPCVFARFLRSRMRSKAALVARREEYGCVEAPWIVERGGYVYLFYSGSMVNWPL